MTDEYAQASDRQAARRADEFGRMANTVGFALDGIGLVAPYLRGMTLVDDAADGGRLMRTTPRSPSAPNSEFTGRFARMNPNELRFSQTTAGGNGRAAARRASMIEQGWNGPAVDAVETVDGIVTIDNTRIAIARELGIPQVPVKVRLPSDPLPPSSLGRFGDATTWGEALQYRTSIQRPPLPPTGTPNPPRLPQ